jgi:hypothetical protein
LSSDSPLIIKAAIKSNSLLNIKEASITVHIEYTVLVNFSKIVVAVSRLLKEVSPGTRDFQKLANF